MTEAMEAHLNAMTTLRAAGRVREHVWVEAERKPVQQIGKGGANKRAVVIDGVTYPQMRGACAKLKISYRTLYNHLASGRARYAA